MNLNKNLLLIVAILGIGLFVLPSTLSMFAGQHSWYNIKSETIPCEKCHFLEQEELTEGPHAVGYNSSLYNSSASSAYLNIWAGADISDRCYGCHQSSKAGFDNDSQHAAITVQCIDCHSWVATELQNDSAAHKAFYVDLNTGQEPLVNAKKACIGCHTHVGVNISWTRAAYLSYNVTIDTDGVYSVDWNTSDTYGTNASRFNSTSEY